MFVEHLDTRLGCATSCEIGRNLQFQLSLHTVQQFAHEPLCLAMPAFRLIRVRTQPHERTVDKHTYCTSSAQGRASPRRAPTVRGYYGFISDSESGAPYWELNSGGCAWRGRTLRTVPTRQKELFAQRVTAASPSR